MDRKMNKDMEDFGWVEMQKLLDKEMPQGLVLVPTPVADMPNVEEKDKKRRLLFFFLFLSLLLSGLSFYYFASKNSANIPMAEQVKKPSIIVNKKLDEVENSIKVPRNTEGGDLKNTKIKDERIKLNTTTNSLNRTKNAELNSKISIQNINNQINVKESNTNASHIELSHHNMQIHKNKDSGKYELEKDSIVSERILEPISGSNLGRNKQEALENIAIFNNLHIASLEDSSIQKNTLKTIENAIREKLPIVSKKADNVKSPLHWGITAGAHTEGGSIVGGYQAGLFLEKNMNKKVPIGVQIGLSYRQTMVKSDSTTFVQLENNIINQSSAPASNFNLAKGTEVKLNTLNYLELPILLNYSPKKRLHVLGGIKLAYLLSNKTSQATGTASRLFVIDSTTLQSANKDAPNATRSNFVFDTSIESLGLNRFDMALVGGISYRILPKMTLSLRADWGLKNILTKKNWAAYNQFVGLNLSYQIK